MTLISSLIDLFIGLFAGIASCEFIYIITVPFIFLSVIAVLKYLLFGR